MRENTSSEIFQWKLGKILQRILYSWAPNKLWLFISVIFNSIKYPQISLRFIFHPHPHICSHFHLLILNMFSPPPIYYHPTPISAYPVIQSTSQQGVCFRNNITLTITTPVHRDWSYIMLFLYRTYNTAFLWYAYSVLVVRLMHRESTYTTIKTCLLKIQYFAGCLSN